MRDLEKRSRDLGRTIDNRTKDYKASGKPRRRPNRTRNHGRGKGKSIFQILLRYSPEVF